MAPRRQVERVDESARIATHAQLLTDRIEQRRTGFRHDVADDDDVWVDGHGEHIDRVRNCRDDCAALERSGADARDRSAVREAVRDELGGICRRILGNIAVFPSHEGLGRFVESLGCVARG